jgi:very-short-patch-repair endonuclease
MLKVIIVVAIRRKQILGDFKRQRPIGRYIVDFYGVEAKLVIELDGSQHFEPDALAYDFERGKFLERVSGFEDIAI